MARPINQIQNFRNKVNQVLSALEDAQGAGHGSLSWATSTGDVLTARYG